MSSCSVLPTVEYYVFIVIYYLFYLRSILGSLFIFLIRIIFILLSINFIGNKYSDFSPCAPVDLLDQ